MQRIHLLRYVVVWFAVFLSAILNALPLFNRVIWQKNLVAFLTWLNEGEAVDGGLLSGKSSPYWMIVCQRVCFLHLILIELSSSTKSVSLLLYSTQIFYLSHHIVAHPILSPIIQLRSILLHEHMSALLLIKNEALNLAVYHISNGAFIISSCSPHGNYFLIWSTFVNTAYFVDFTSFYFRWKNHWYMQKNDTFHYS